MIIGTSGKSYGRDDRGDGQTYRRRDKDDCPRSPLPESTQPTA
jgi:hypothetical protein